MGEKRKEKAIDKALELVRQGKSYRETAKICRIDRSTVTRWAKRAHIESPLAKKEKLVFEEPVPVEEPKLTWRQKIKKLLGI